MTKGIELYQRADALQVSLENSEGISSEQIKEFEKIVKDFFKEPIQESGFSSDVILRKINAIFEKHFKNYYLHRTNADTITYNCIILPCYIDCFAAKIIEYRDLKMLDNIMKSSPNIELSNSILDFYYKVLLEINIIAEEVARYLVKEYIDLDNMSEMISANAANGKIMSKFIDKPNIPEHEGLAIRLWITHDINNSKEIQVRMIIVPDEGAASIPYDITKICKDWIDTFA